MKIKILIFTFVVFLGCSYHKKTVIEISGENLRYPIGISSASGDGEIKIYREVTINGDSCK